MGRAVPALFLTLIFVVGATCRDAQAAIATAPSIHQLSVFEDSSGRLDLRAVSQRRGEFLQLSTPRLGRSRSAFWVRLEVTASSDQALLEMNYSQNDYIDVHARAADGTRRVYRAGDLRPRNTALPSFRNPVFAIPTRDGPTEVFIRVRSDGLLAVPLLVHDRAQFERRLHRDGLLWGFFFGVLAAMAVYNGLLFTSLKERAYLWYSLYLAGLVLLFTALSGLGRLLIWPGALTWGNAAAAVALALTMPTAVMFLREMCGARLLAPRWHRGLFALAVTLPATLLIAPISYRAFSATVVALSAVAILALAPPIAIGALRGGRTGRLAGLGYAIMLPAGGGALFSQIVDLPSSLLLEFGPQIGMVAEAMIWSFALSQRVRQAQHEREAVRQRLIATERQAQRDQAAFSRRLIAAQDDERRHIARDIHDGVGQDLLVHVNQVKRLAKRGAEQSQLRDLGDRAAEIVGDLRTLARRLHPQRLEQLGLDRAIESSARAAFDETDVELLIDCDSVGDALTAEQQLHVYRIAQEAIGNIVRHAQATRVRISLKVNEADVALQIEDDGRGIDATHDAGGIGLRTMRERAELLGGQLAMSEPPGLRITLGIPRANTPADR